MNLKEINEFRKAAGQDPIDEGLWDSIKAGAAGLRAGAGAAGSMAASGAQRAAGAVGGAARRAGQAVGGAAGAVASKIRSYQAEIQKAAQYLVGVRNKLEQLGLGRPEVNKLFSQFVTAADRPAGQPEMASQDFSKIIDKFIVEHNIKE